MANRDTAFFGHPVGLRTLFLTEMWERFSYYGMRALLILFMATAVEEGGLGFSSEKAGLIYGMYTSLVYLMPLAGGWLADNVLGLRRSVLFGGIVIMCGHILLMLHGTSTFFCGLGCVVLGVGLLKGNISAIVGQLYTPEDRRRDAGFSLFYMGINIGAFSAPLACGWLAQSDSFKARLQGWGLDPLHSWHWGFGAAAVGMFFGVTQYLITSHNMGEAGLRVSDPSPEARARARRTLLVAGGCIAAVAAALGLWAWLRPALVTAGNVSQLYALILFGCVLAFFVWLLRSPVWTPLQRRRLVVVLMLFAGSAIFWGVFEQAGSTLSIFADESTDNRLLGWAFPSSWWQSVNAGMLVLLSPVFAWLWMRLGDFDPSSVLRFTIALLCAGLSFALLVPAAHLVAEGKVSPLWLLTVYFLHTIGELCLSPVGLSSMTRLAPARVQGMMLGVWFASLSVGNFLGGQVASVYERFELPTLFAAVAGGALAMTLVMAFLVPLSRRLLARQD